MLKNLKILSLLQLSEKIKFKQNASLSDKLRLLGKFLMAMAISYGVLTLLFFVIFKVIFFQPSIHLFTFIIFFIQLISIVTSTISLSDSLYISKDNALLLTYPVKHIYVYISKLIVSYVLELVKSLLFTLPLFMAYATINSSLFSVYYVIGSFVYSFLLPLFPVLIGAILSIPVVYFNKFIKKYNLLKLLLTVMVFVGLLALTIFVVNLLPDNIRIVALFNSFMTKFNDSLHLINQFSTYSGFIGKAMYGENIFLNTLFALLSLIGVGVISISLSLFVFFRLASSASENSIQKKHKAKNVAHKSTFLTFTKKELTLSLRNIGDFASNYFFLFIMPFVLIIISSIYVRIDRNALGVSMTYGFIGLIAMIMLAASNTASATAISSEGTEFVLLKTAPGKTSNIVWSKILINFVISLIFLTLSFVILSFVLKNHVSLPLLWIVYGFILIIDFGLILWSIQLDIMNPKLKEYANSQNRSEIKNFASSITIGCIVAIIFSAILIVVYLFNFTIFLLCLILLGLALVFTSIRLYFLINYMNAYFNEIQL